jgi:hypothetical protein
VQTLSPFTRNQSGCLHLGEACPVQGLLHVDGLRAMRMVGCLALASSRNRSPLLCNMGGQRAILLSLLGLLHFVATPLPVLGANVISRSDNACAEKDKAGHTLSQGSADSLPGNVSVYSCVYTEGINCQYFLSVRASAP